MQREHRQKHRLSLLHQELYLLVAVMPTPCLCGPGYAAPLPAHQTSNGGNFVQAFVGRLTANMAAVVVLVVLGSVNDA